MNKSRILILLMSLVIVAALPASAGEFTRTAHSVAGSYVVGLVADPAADDGGGVGEAAKQQRRIDRATALGQRYGVIVTDVFDVSPQLLAVHASEERAMALAEDADVSFVTEDGDLLQPLQVNTGDPSAPESAWNLDRIDQRKELDGNYSFAMPNPPDPFGAGAIVYVVDTGISPEDRKDFFDGRLQKGYDAETQIESPSKDHPASHGIHVAATIAGTGIGVARGAEIVPVVIKNDLNFIVDCESGNPPTTTEGMITILLRALDWIEKQGCPPDPKNHPELKGRPGVVNLSISLSQDQVNDGSHYSAELLALIDRPIRDKLKSLVSHGFLIVMGAGNAGVDTSRVDLPWIPVATEVDGIISVGATARTGADNGSDEPASWPCPEPPPGKPPLPFCEPEPLCKRRGTRESCCTPQASNFGNKVEMWAPGDDTLAESNFRFSGTSAAAPHVAGAAAIFWRKFSSPALLERFLKDVATTRDTVQAAGMDPKINRFLFLPLTPPRRRALSSLPLIQASPSYAAGPLLLGESTTLSVVVDPAYASSATYQWYEGIAGDLGLSTAIGQSQSTLEVSPDRTTAYWVRVTAGDLSEDSENPVVPVTVQGVTALEVSTGTLCPGEEAVGTLTLTGPSGPGGTLVSLRSSSLAVRVPDRVTVPAGQDTATFPITAVGGPFPATAVLSASSNTGAASAEVQLRPALTIVRQPEDDSEILPAGGSTTAQATVGVSGTAPFSYEWRDAGAGGAIVAGPSTSSLPTNPFSLTFTAAGSRTVVARITDACGQTATSTPATLSAGSCAFRITGFGPTNATTASVAQPVQLWVEMDPPYDPAHPNYTFEWMKGDGTPISGSGPTLYVTTGSFSSFRVRVTSTACQRSLTSPLAYVKVYGTCPLPEVTVSPSSQTVPINNTGLVQAFTTWPDVHYQWYRGESGDTHQPLAAVLHHGDQLAVGDSPSRYWVRVTNPCGQNVDSAAVSVSREQANGGICDSVSIGALSADQDVASGDPVTLWARASSSSVIDYQWFAEGAEVVGATGPQYKAHPLETTSYFVRATNACGGFLDSRIITAHVTSCGPNSFSTQPADTPTDNLTPVTLTAATSGPSMLQWYEGPSGDRSHPLGNANGTSFTTPLLSASTSYWVRATTSDGCQFDSRTAQVDVCVKPQATLGDAGYRNITPGEYLWIGFHYAGTGLRYQWFIGESGDTSQPLGNGTDLIQVHPIQTTKYWVRVSNRCGTADSPTYTISICPGISELTASASIVMPNGSVNLHALDAGPFPSYQWYRGLRGDRDHPLAPGANVTTPPLTEPTHFWCMVASGTCGVMSDELVVDVCPANQVSFLGEGVGGAHTQARMNELQFLKVVAPTGVQFSYYQGQSGDVAHSTLLEGRTNNYSITVTPSATTSYWVREHDPNGICFSDTPTLTINVCVPQIVTQPLSKTVTPGTAVHLTVASDIAGSTYQWFTGTPASPTLISGATGPALDFTATATKSYYARVTGTCSTAVDSSVATVTICNPPAITSQPQSTVKGANGADLGVVATGSGLTYQWFVGNSGITTSPIGTNSASIHVSPTTTTNYWARVSSTCGTANSAAATVTVCTNLITQQPTASPASLVAGQTTTLTVGATGTALHYQWYRGASGDRSQPVGTDAATYTTPALNANATYWVEVRSGLCSTQSAAVNVPVCTPPSVSFNPLTTQVRSGQAQTLTVTPVSGATYNFYSGTSGDLAHSTALATTSANTFNIAPTVTTSYWASATLGCTGNTPTVTINVCIPQVTAQPASAQINAGQSVHLTVGTNVAPVTYQWYTGAAGNTATPIAGATGSSLDVTPGSTTSYWVRITGSCGSSVDSAAATVTVCVLPQITAQPYDSAPIYSGFAGGTGVQAAGTGLTYQWYQGESGVTSTPVANATAATLTITRATASARYWVRVSNSCGSVNSNAAWVSVYPVAQSQPQDATVNPGSTATLSFGATGTYLHYHWYQGFDRTHPVGTDSPTLITPSLTVDTSYFCDAVSGTAGTTSRVATVSMCSGPAVAYGPTKSSLGGGCYYLNIADTQGTSSITWYQGQRGDASQPRSSSNGFQVCGVTQSTTFWARLTDGATGCSTDSSAVSVP